MILQGFKLQLPWTIYKHGLVLLIAIFQSEIGNPYGMLNNCSFDFDTLDRLLQTCHLIAPEPLYLLLKLKMRKVSFTIFKCPFLLEKAL